MAADENGVRGSGVPLYRKLGMKEGSVVVLKGAPPGFEAQLAGRPPSSVLSRRARSARDLTVWFVTTRRSLAAEIDGVVGALATGALWICWPKKSGRTDTDLSFESVQRAGLERGLVDHKVCAVDDTWTALRFARRRESSPRRRDRRRDTTISRCANNSLPHPFHTP
ncbi:MAG TPA: hypothetical protein VMD28_05525 [Acidimicrobiales bacterium]|nr:hypothetical protein [Acidimicrobiales bacterium]